MNLVLLFDISGGEFLLIGVVILMLFGSKSIPELARGLGKGMREFRDATNQIKREISDSGEKLKQDLNPGIPTSVDQWIEESEKPIIRPVPPPVSPAPKAETNSDEAMPTSTETNAPASNPTEVPKKDELDT
jgi:sec-independent protein translocase protein TatA